VALSCQQCHAERIKLPAVRGEKPFCFLVALADDFEHLGIDGLGRLPINPHAQVIGHNE